MDYFKNADKFWNADEVALYNTVISVDVSGEGGEPVPLDEAKLWCKIDDNDTDDDLLSALITAARQVCETASNIGFITRNIVAGINNADGGFGLPYAPVTSTPSATLVDGTPITDLMYNMNQIQSPYGRMIVSYTAGYVTLPQNLKTALKQQIIFMYENRGEGTTTLSPMAQMILLPLRRT